MPFDVGAGAQRTFAFLEERLVTHRPRAELRVMAAWRAGELLDVKVDGPVGLVREPPLNQRGHELLDLADVFADARQRVRFADVQLSHVLEEFGLIPGSVVPEDAMVSH